jgi:hypothetical protein
MWKLWNFFIIFYLISFEYSVTKVINTYAWIKDTALSKVVKMNGQVINKKPE